MVVARRYRVRAGWVLAALNGVAILLLPAGAWPLAVLFATQAAILAWVARASEPDPTPTPGRAGAWLEQLSPRVYLLLAAGLLLTLELALFHDILLTEAWDTDDWLPLLSCERARAGDPQTWRVLLEDTGLISNLFRLLWQCGLPTGGGEHLAFLRLTAFLWHGANGLLILMLARELGLDRSSALAAAVVLVASPYAAEPLAILSAMEYLYSLAFVLGAALAFARHRTRGRRRDLILCLVCIVLGLLAKETAILVVGLIPLLELLAGRLGRESRTPFLKAYAPVVAVCLALAAVVFVRMAVMGNWGYGLSPGWGRPPPGQLLADLHAATVGLLARMVAPLHQGLVDPMYPQAPWLADLARRIALLLAAAVLAAAASGIARSWRAALCGATCAVVGRAVLVRFAEVDWLLDNGRYYYYAAAGFALLAAALLGGVPQRWLRRATLAGLLVSAVLAVLPSTRFTRWYSQRAWDNLGRVEALAHQLPPGHGLAVLADQFFDEGEVEALAVALGTRMATPPPVHFIGRLHHLADLPEPTTTPILRSAELVFLVFDRERWQLTQVRAADVRARLARQLNGIGCGPRNAEIQLELPDGRLSLSGCLAVDLDIFDRSGTGRF